MELEFARIKDFTDYESSKEENALHDAMTTVTKFLGIKDLCRTAQVCRSWMKASVRERALRFYIQRLVIEPNVDDIIGQLEVKPYVSLLFFGDDAESSHEDASDNRVLESCKKRLPDNLVGAVVCEVLTEMGKASSVGLFVPFHPDAWITLRWSTGDAASIQDAADQMVDELLLGEKRLISENSKATLLLFAYTLKGYFVADHVIQSIRERSTCSSETIWGGLLKRRLEVKRNDDEEEGEVVVVALRILSTSLRSWSLLIDCGQSCRDLDSILHAFAQKIERKRHVVGLAYGPSKTKIGRRKRKRYADAREIMGAIGRILQGVRFVGLFDASCRVLFGLEALDEGRRQKLDLDNYMSIIVMAYD